MKPTDKLTPRRLTKREVAEQIATELFTNGLGQRATRLVLEGDNLGDHGGWAYMPAVLQIEKILGECLE